MSTALAPAVQTNAQPCHVPAPEFTLGTALAWLGHHCIDRCSVTLDTLGAMIWFIQQPTSPWLLPDDTLIVLDLAPSVMPAIQSRRLLRQINACAQADGIRVCARPGDDHAPALAPVARDRNAFKFRYELDAVGSALDSRAPRPPGHAAAGGT